MDRNTGRTLLTAICSLGMLTAMLIGSGCSNAGEMSVTGFHDSRSSRLAGDECDELMLAAAEADGEEREEAKAAYRECVEKAAARNGHDAECSDERDPTCDIILDEIEATIDRVRQERGDGDPDCDAPQSNGDEALCLLMTAYETCQLDHDGDGKPDVDDGNGEPDDDGQGGDSDREDGDREHDDDGDGGDDQSEDGDHEETDGGGDGIDDKSCEEIRDLHADVGADDREFLERERPECFDGGDEADAETDDNADDAFCAELEEEILNVDSEDRKAELQELFERECVD